MYLNAASAFFSRQIYPLTRQLRRVYHTTEYPVNTTATDPIFWVKVQERRYEQRRVLVAHVPHAESLSKFVVSLDAGRGVRRQLCDPTRTF